MYRCDWVSGNIWTVDMSRRNKQAINLDFLNLHSGDFSIMYFNYIGKTKKYSQNVIDELAEILIWKEQLNYIKNKLNTILYRGPKELEERKPTYLSFLKYCYLSHIENWIHRRTMKNSIISGLFY